MNDNLEILRQTSDHGVILQYWHDGVGRVPSGLPPVSGTLMQKVVVDAAHRSI